MKLELADKWEEFKYIQQHLAGVTAELLAHGLPIYQINVDDPMNMHIKQIGVIGQKTA